MSWQTLRERIRETWMCESTEWIERVAQLGHLGADVVAHLSAWLERFGKERFRAYVSETNEAWENEQEAAQSPTAPPEFLDPQHGAAEPSTVESWQRAIGLRTTVGVVRLRTLCPYGREPAEPYCVGCSCPEREAAERGRS